MSTRDENLLKDQHLQKALQHAPDSDIAPSDATRKIVLDYADKALAPRRESCFARAINAFNAWQIPRWQLTGMGSLAASLLVVVMIWHENPDDPMQVATAPSEISEAASIAASKLEPESEAKLAQTELARDDLNKAERSPQAAAEVAPVANESFAASAQIAVSKLQDKAKENVLAKTKPAKPETETAPQPAAIEAPGDKTVIASAPEAASGQVMAKDTATVQASSAPTPVAAAPAPVAESASEVASTDASAEGASKPADIAMPRKKMEDTEQAQSEAKADLPGATAAAKSALASNTTLAQAISKEGGKAMANKDIQAGNFRILYLSKPTPAGAPLLDVATGYRIEFIVGNSATLTAEVTAYNQTMRDWHLNQSK